jgi:hypothetical protein
VRTLDRRLVTNPQDLPAKLHDARGNYGKFRVTPKRRAILASAGEGAATVILFLGFLAQPFSTEPVLGAQPLSDDAAAEDVEVFVGDVTGVTALKLRQKAGGYVISRVVKDGSHLLAGATGGPVRGHRRRSNRVFI